MAGPTFKPPVLDTSLLPEQFCAVSEIAIESREDLEQAVQAIRWLRCSRAEIDEALTRQTMPLQQQAEQLKRVRYERGRHDAVEASFEELEQALAEAVAKFVKRQKRTLFDGDAKTLKLNSGEVSLRTTPLAITYGKLTKARITEKICAHFDCLGKIVDYALKLGVRPFLKLKADLDVTAIKAAYNQGEIGDEELKELGLKAETKEVVDVKHYA